MSLSPTTLRTRIKGNYRIIYRDSSSSITCMPWQWQELFCAPSLHLLMLHFIGNTCISIRNLMHVAMSTELSLIPRRHSIACERRNMFYLKWLELFSFFSLSGGCGRRCCCHYIVLCRHFDCCLCGKWICWLFRFPALSHNNCSFYN